MRRRDLLQSTGWLQLCEAACPRRQETAHDSDAGVGGSKVHGRHQVREKPGLRRHQRVQGAGGRLQQQRGVRQHHGQLRVYLQDRFQTRQSDAGLRRYQRMPIAGTISGSKLTSNDV